MKPVLEDIGDLFVYSVQENFQVGGRHSGDPDSIFGGSQSWEDWSPKYQQKRNEERGGGQILILDGHLSGSIGSTATNDDLEISASMPYAYRQHHGGGGIPARPFLVLQEEDVEDALEEISSFLINGK